jgi:hypothetical protein
MCPFHCRRPFFAESKTFATQHAALIPISCSVVPQNPDPGSGITPSISLLSTLNGELSAIFKRWYPDMDLEVEELPVAA